MNNKDFESLPQTLYIIAQSLESIAEELVRMNTHLERTHKPKIRIEQDSTKLRDFLNGFDDDTDYSDYDTGRDILDEIERRQGGRK